MDKVYWIAAALLMAPASAGAIPTVPGDPSSHFATAPGLPAQTMPVVTKNPAVLPPYQLYSYYGERYRDPFIPLVGLTIVDNLGDRAPQTATLALKGIIQDAQGRMALLTSGMTSYILKGGRLYDGRNKIVKGISGVIKKESVVVVGADRAVRELRVKAAL